MKLYAVIHRDHKENLNGDTFFTKRKDAIENFMEQYSCVLMETWADAKEEGWTVAKFDITLEGK